MVRALTDAFLNVAQAISELTALFSFFSDDKKEALVEWWETLQSSNEELSREWKRDLHKLDFTRPKIQHQVLDRKPKNLIKKIIR